MNDDITKNGDTTPVEPGSTNEPSASSVSPLPPNDTKKGSRKRVFTIIAILIVVLIVVAVAATFFLLKKEAPDSKDQLTAATNFSSARELVDSVAPQLEGKLIETAVANGISAYDADGRYIYGAPVLRMDDEGFGVLPLTVTGEGYASDAAQADANYKALQEFFKKNKFVENVNESSIAGRASDADGAVQYVGYGEYQSSTMLCSTYHIDATPTELGAHLVSVGCAEKASYNEAAKSLKPFFTAYKKVNNTVSQDVVLGLQTVSEGSEGSEGYSYALIYVEDERQFKDDQDATPLIGYFYKAANSSDWVYADAVSVNETAYCTFFETDILMKAFKGTECYDASTQQYRQV